MSGPFDIASTAKAIHDSIEAAQAAIPEGHSQAFLLDATYARGDGTGVRALYVRRVETGWTIAAEEAYTRKDGFSTGVAVRWSGQ